MECYTTHLGLWGRVKNCRTLDLPLPFPPLFLPDLANHACPFALHACRHEVKPRACNKLWDHLGLEVDKNIFYRQDKFETEGI